MFTVILFISATVGLLVSALILTVVNSMLTPIFINTSMNIDVNDEKTIKRFNNITKEKKTLVCVYSFIGWAVCFLLPYFYLTNKYLISIFTGLSLSFACWFVFLLFYKNPFP